MKKKMLSLLIVIVMVLGLFPVSAMAADSITVYVTISNKGVLAADKNGEPMGYRAVTVTDLDDDGDLTVSDALIAAHTQFSKNGAADYEFKSGQAKKLWGTESTNLLALLNNCVFYQSWSGRTISDGDHVVASINKDAQYYADWLTYFDVTTKEVMAGTEFTLTLKGFQGMNGGGAKAAAGVSIGTWISGTFSAIEDKTTDASGQVTLSFDTPGTYYVTANGTVKDQVTDWSTGTSREADCPIMAPICIVTVTRCMTEQEQAEAVAEDKEVLDITYTNGEDLTLPSAGASGETKIVWNSNKPSVISNEGVVTKQTEEQAVTLTATIICGEQSDTKTFEITVPAMSAGERMEAAKAVLTAENLTPVEFSNPGDIAGTYKFESPAKDTNILAMANSLLDGLDVEIGWADGFSSSLIAEDGSITYPTDGNQSVELAFKLTAGSGSAPHSVTVTIPKHAQTKTEGINAMIVEMPNHMQDADVLNGNSSLVTVMTELKLPIGTSTGIHIDWTSSNEDVIKIDSSSKNTNKKYPTGRVCGTIVTRPDVGEDDVTVTLTFKPYYDAGSTVGAAGPMPDPVPTGTITVNVPAVTSDEMQAIVDNAASDIKITDKNGAVADLSNIKDSLYFPSYEGYTAKWTTDLPIAIPSKGYDKSPVTRPTGGTDAVGTITLTLTKGETVKTKSFDAKVLAWTEPELEAERAKLQKVADALTFDEIRNKNTAPTAVASNLYLRQNAKLDGEKVTFNTYNSSSYLYQIAWTITPTGIITFNNGTGKITTPAQDTEISLTATISLKTPIAGVNAVEKTITVTVLSAETADYLSLMNNIAAKYAASGVADDAQAPWLAADMAAYLKLFPDTANKLSDEQKQAMVDLAVEKLAIAETPGDAAKYIIALVSMGYDPTQLTTAKLAQLNAMEKLNTLSFGEGGAITEAAKSPYTLPYVLIAYQQFGDTYQAQIDKLIAAAVETKSAWMSTEWGPDSITPMVLALAPYSSKTEVASVLEEAKTAIVSTQIEGGALSSYGSGSAASTGLGVVAYAALGIAPETVVTTDKHLMDGLMSYATDNKDGFEEPYGGSFNTEQGFRGLIAYYGLKSGSPYRLYDFSGQTLVSAAATEAQAENCDVQIITTPAEASVVVKKGDAEQASFKTGHYDLAAGEYTYTVTCSSYTTKTETFTVSAEDVTAGTKTVRVSLSAVPVNPDAGKVNASISVVNPHGGYYQSETTRDVAPGTTVAELLQSLGLNVVSSNHAEYGFYVESINGVGEFDYGSGSGWMYKVNGEFIRTSASDYVLQEGDVVEWVYTRNLGADVGAGSYKKPLTAAQKAEAAKVSGLIGAIGTVTKESGDAIKAARAAYDALSPEQQALITNYDALVAAEKKFAELTGTLPFNDVTTNDYFYEAVRWAAEKGITSGTSETTFSPHASCTRAQMVTFLWRAAGSPEPTGAVTAFIDVDQASYYYKALLWAVESGITSGTSGTTFSPDVVCTRGQMAMFLYRSAKNPTVSGGNSFDDVNETAYYKDAVLWAKSNGITAGTSATTFSPDAACTRAQMVTFLYRYLAE